MTKVPTRTCNGLKNYDACNGSSRKVESRMRLKMKRVWCLLAVSKLKIDERAVVMVTLCV